MITKFCIVCGKEFKVLPYRKGTAKFCSVDCKTEYRKGRKQSIETIRKKIKSMTGLKRHPLTKEVKEKIGNSLKGRIIPEEVRVKIGIKSKKTWDTMSKEKKKERNAKISISKMRNKNPNWKGGITPIRTKIWTSIKYKLWRLSIFERDNFTCQMLGCGEKGGKLEAHHIRTWKKFPKLRFRIDNGITLCKRCHQRIKNREEKYEELFSQIIKTI